MAVTTAGSTRDRRRAPAPADAGERSTATLSSLLSPSGLISRLTPLPVSPGLPRFHVALASVGDVGAVLGGAEGAQARQLSGYLDGAGTGLAAEPAATTAMAEALERYSSCIVDPRQLVTATADELGADALDLDTLPRCSAAELAHPDCPVRSASRRAPIRWVRGVSLTRHTPVWVPASLTYLLPSPDPNERFTLPISTGCAAHRTYVEAVRSALCEVIERDALTLTWLLRRPLRRLEIDASGPELRAARDLGFSRVGEVHLFDATTTAQSGSSGVTSRA
jgi:ribosomal protein S12 methylthiotransferase accessory factor